MRPSALLVAVLLALSLPLAARAEQKDEPVVAGDTVTVTHIEAKVMSSPKPLGRSLATVQRNDQLKVVSVLEGEKAGWLEVSLAGGKRGFIRDQFVQKSAVKLARLSGSGKSHVSADEVALAGRGFSEKVEKRYQEKHRELDYRHVDRIQALTVSPETAAAFAKAGGLGGAE